VNYPVWEIGPGTGLAVALVATVHSFVAHFAVGGGLFLTVTELRARRAGDRPMLGWLEAHSRFFTLLSLVLGSLSGVLLWVVVGVVQPVATSALSRLFLWTWAVTWVLFAVSAAAALFYESTWDRVGPRTHLAFGALYTAASLGALALVNGILSFMLSPGRWLRGGGLSGAFWNAGYWPALATRLSLAVAFAGIFAFSTAWRAPAALRTRIARLSARWALPGLAASLAFGFWWLETTPLGREAVGGASPRAANALRLALSAGFLLATVLLSLLALARQRPSVVSSFAASVLLALGYLTLAGGEYLRESLRKPYIVGNPAEGWIFDDGLTAPQAEEARREGLLRRAAFRADAGRPPALADESARGADVFRHACLCCHSVEGYGGVRRFVDGRSRGAILTVLRALERRPGRMPPFPGTEEEMRLLARYLDGLDGVVSSEPDPGSLDARALGARVGRDFCLACHVLDGPPVKLPLRPRLRDWSEAEAYERLGRLSRTSPEMIDFDGTERERRALAAWIAAEGRS